MSLLVKRLMILAAAWFSVISVAEHSGHGLQNDDRVYAAYMDAAEQYLDKYMGSGT